MLSVGKRDQHGSIRDSAFRVYSYIEAPEAASIHRVGNGISKYQVIKISASTDGGPPSQVCACETLRSAPHRHERKFSGTRFCRVTFKIFEKNLKKPKNRPQGARGWGFEFYFFPIIFIIFF